MVIIRANEIVIDLLARVARDPLETVGILDEVRTASAVEQPGKKPNSNAS